jgi:hypothetical protein
LVPYPVTSISARTVRDLLDAIYEKGIQQVFRYATVYVEALEALGDVEDVYERGSGDGQETGNGRRRRCLPIVMVPNAFAGLFYEAFIWVKSLDFVDG